MNHYSFHEMFPACGRRLVACLTNNMNLSGSYDGGAGFIPSRTTPRAGVRDCEKITDTIWRDVAQPPRLFTEGNHSRGRLCHISPYCIVYLLTAP